MPGSVVGGKSTRWDLCRRRKLWDERRVLDSGRDAVTERKEVGVPFR